MKHFALKIAYNGTFFSGFAPQKTKHIQSVSEKILEVLQSMGIDSLPLGAGRTDKGVHALGMVITISAQEHWEANKLHHLLSQKLYPYIFIRKIWEVKEDFHPRFSATKRSYYYIFSPHLQNPFLAPYISHEHIGDIALFRQCLEACIGWHNFELFKKQGSKTKSDIRHIMYAKCKILHRFHSTYYLVHIQANGFLRAQIRMLIGAALAVSQGKLTFAEFCLQLNATKQHHTSLASPQGLFFAKVWY